MNLSLRILSLGLFAITTSAHAGNEQLVRVIGAKLGLDTVGQVKNYVGTLVEGIPEGGGAPLNNPCLIAVRLLGTNSVNGIYVGISDGNGQALASFVMSASGIASPNASVIQTSPYRVFSNLIDGPTTWAMNLSIDAGPYTLVEINTSIPVSRQDSQFAACQVKNLIPANIE